MSLVIMRTYWIGLKVSYQFYIFFKKKKINLEKLLELHKQYESSFSIGKSISFNLPYYGGSLISMLDLLADWWSYDWGFLDSHEKVLSEKAQ